jgi:hypothetical protein
MFQEGQEKDDLIFDDRKGKEAQPLQMIVVVMIIIIIIFEECNVLGYGTVWIL